MKTGYLVSDFDLFGTEDLDLIRQTLSRCDQVVLLVLNDADVFRFCGRDPIFPLGERLAIATSIVGVAGARVFRDADFGISDHLFISSRLDAGEVEATRLSCQTTTASPELNRVLHRSPEESAIERSPRPGTIGYVPGGWDIFHVGHLNLLMQARGLCEKLVIGVVTDEELTAMKGAPPVVPLSERVLVLDSLDLVDQVVIDTSRDKRLIWLSVHFDLLIKGSDWQGTPKGNRLEYQMASIGVRVHYLPYTTHISSRQLRSRLSPSGQMKAAR